MEKFSLSKKQVRSVQADSVKVDAESRTMEFSFSSEVPYERWFGMEIISHEKGAVNLDRLNTKAALLFNHDWDKQIGVVEKAWIGEDRRGHVRVKFGKSAFAQEKFQDVQDEMLTSVSYGYSIDEMILSKKGENGLDEYTVTKSTPYEVSLVTVPADITVGVGRVAERSAGEELIKLTTSEEEAGEKVLPVVATTKGSNMEDLEKAKLAERERIAAITALGDKFGMQDLARTMVNGEKTVADMQQAVLEKMAVKQVVIKGDEADIGLTEKEVQQFSFIRAINALANPGNRRMQEAAKFEIEVSLAGAKKRGKESQGIFVPYEILRAQRDLSKGTPSAGGYLVATEHRAESFIEMLRKKSILDRAGATVLNGLVGDLAIPKQTGGATAYWVGEGSAPTESQQTFGQVAMAPKTVGAFTDLSRKLILQSSPDVENLVKKDLATVLALAIDIAGLYGSGSSNQPQGLTNVSGINTKDFAAAMPTYAELVAMESLIAADDADVENMKYLTEPTVRGAMKTAVKFSSTASPIWEPGNTMNGYPALVSNQITAEDVFFGNWADLMIGYWSGLDMNVDTAALATSGGLRVIVLQDCDVAVRHAESFCWGNDAQ